MNLLDKFFGDRVENPKNEVKFRGIRKLFPTEDDCKFRGSIKMSPSFGSQTFQASAELHQKHSNSFTCQSVIFMERKEGRHIVGCSHVGYLTSKACKCG